MVPGEAGGAVCAGETARGNITWPGYEHLVWEAVVQTMEPERLFSFTWHPYSVDPKMDYSKETPTLVEFRLEEVAGGTLLRLTSRGFDKIPAARRDEAFLRNDGGWAQQMKNIEAHVAAGVVARDRAARWSLRAGRACLRRWATRHGWRWWRSCAAESRCRSRS